MRVVLAMIAVFAVAACDSDASSVCVVNCSGTIAVDAGEDLTVFEG